jgi:uncharacterized membrane protein YcaP (DUF421 family)
MLFNGWTSVLRIVLNSVVVYVVVVAALRIAGARALAKMSGYDLIVTVTLGSIVANVAMTPTISAAEAVAAIATLLLLQEVTRRLQARSRHAHHLVRERPHLVVWDGDFLEDVMQKISVTHDEVRAAVRRAGLLSVSQVQAVVLENDGEWSVMPRSEARDLSALEGLRIPYLLPPGGDPGRWRERDGDGSERRTPGKAAEGAPVSGDPT